MAPCTPALCDYFVAILHVAPNRLKFGMSHSFCVKKCPCVFFHKRGSKASNTFLKVQTFLPPPFSPLPPPPSPSNSIMTHAQCFGPQRSKFGDGQRAGGGGGGGLNLTQFGPYFSIFLKKIQGHFLTQKESTCQISDDSEQLGKSLRNSHMGPACTELLNCFIHLFLD